MVQVLLEPTPGTKLLGLPDPAEFGELVTIESGAITGDAPRGAAFPGV